MKLNMVLQQLQKERKKVADELGRLDTAITALSHNGSQRAGSKPRVMSAAARKRIAAAQRARWAAWKAKRKKST